MHRHGAPGRHFLSRQLREKGPQVYYEPSLTGARHDHAGLDKLPDECRFCRVMLRSFSVNTRNDFSESRCMHRKGCPMLRDHDEARKSMLRKVFEVVRARGMVSVAQEAWRRAFPGRLAYFPECKSFFESQVGLEIGGP